MIMVENRMVYGELSTTDLFTSVLFLLLLLFTINCQTL